jgi:hypothetical protein
MHQRLRTENIRPAMNNGTTTLNVIADTVWMCEASDWRRRRLSDWVVRILFEGILEQQVGYDPNPWYFRRLVVGPRHCLRSVPLLIPIMKKPSRSSPSILTRFGLQYYCWPTTTTTDNTTMVPTTTIPPQHIYIHTYIHTHNCIHTSTIYT